uniref:Uncharacterized protein n=1 Tax=Brassica oleracea TaxID=3712 RepID=A0A3P6F2K1_BRAOL|nr:unnamed protein product [Brassica oleracea]
MKRLMWAMASNQTSKLMNLEYKMLRRFCRIIIFSWAKSSSTVTLSRSTCRSMRWQTSTTTL